MNINESRKKLVFIILFALSSGVMLWDNARLRLELDDIHKVERHLARYGTPAEEYRQKGIEWEQAGKAAAVLYTLVAAHKGNADAQYELGYYDLPKKYGKDNARDEQWLISAAKQGNPLHQNYLASWYYNQNSRKDDTNARKSFYWYMEAAKNNDAEAMMMLGNYYRSGMGCSIDLVQAEYWLKQAIEHADTRSVIGTATAEMSRHELAKVYALTDRRDEAYAMLQDAKTKGDQTASLILSSLKEEESKKRANNRLNTKR